ncbi:signal peptidase I [Luethyella okanaganae]|uniref:Signal peptidase I n=1 Tax=Luethyella okanaganae TaxID=69372 RepID=A0ABW1VAQ8_9MICO
MARSRRGVIGGVALNLAAVGGLLCIALTCLAFFLGVTLIMFKTGSMGPTIPAGSLAVVREIPASEVVVGDVVTVDRAGALPITHRVVSISRFGSGSQRSLVLKGDANEVEDPLPYTVDSVRMVLWSAPGLAYVVVWLANPWVLGSLTIGSSALVTWAFWPRGERAIRRTGRHSPGVASTALAVLVICSVGTVAADPPSAAAAPTEQIFTGRYITLTTISDERAMASLASGSPVRWEVGVAASPPEPGEVKILLSGAGSAELGLLATIRSCRERWTDSDCATGASIIADAEPLPVDGVERLIESMPSSEQRWLLFEVSMPGSPVQDDAAHTVVLRVHASGSGDDASTVPGAIGGLSATGSELASLLAAGAVAMALGIALLVTAQIFIARRRRRAG